MSRERNRNFVKSHRAKAGKTPFKVNPVTVTKTDPKTGEVLSKEVVQDPLSYDKSKRFKYFQDNLSV